MNSSHGKERSALLRAYLAIEDLEARLRAAERAMREPIAIVGLAGRFPGADNAGAFWSNLRDGIDSITEIPRDRWDIDAFFDPDPEAPGRMYSRHGGFVSRPDCFDAHFFGIAPREALSLDPQQRLLLEVAWEALEDAAIPPHQLARTPTGVFVGITGSDFSHLGARSSDMRAIDPYSGTGSAVCVAPGRLSYILGLQGPSLAIDTACSSSLVAVHLACQSLRLGECRTALACGVNAILIPEGHIYFCKIRALSPAGRCRTFDAAADGYTRGEGCGVVVLKRLSDALSAGDRILALIRGSAINHDGPSGGLTMPNGVAQEAVVRAALANAGVQPEEVGYVEAHGTGTQLGDPIELHALGSVYPSALVGSVKTNIGHLEAAAGIAGLIKVVLSLRNRTIPRHLHFTNPNPLVAWDRLGLAVPTAPQPWDDRRVAGVSAFGFSGTNAHVILAQAPEPAPVPRSTRAVHILTLSAKTDAALRELRSRYDAYLASTTESLADICYTSNVGRSHLACRFAVAARSIDDLRMHSGQAPAPEIVSSYLSGADIDWTAFHADHPCRKVALPAYPFQRERYWSAALSPQPSCLYSVDWEDAPLPPGVVHDAAPRPWLVIPNGSPLAGPLINLLEGAGRDCTTEIPDDTRAVFEGIIQFAPPDEDDPARVCSVTLDLIQRLAGFSILPRLWVVTQGAHAVTSGPAGLRPAHSALWGLASVIASEFPAARCTRIDLDSETAPDAGAMCLFNELCAADSEDQVAWRGSRRHVRRLRRLQSALPAPVALHPEAVYLITGGLGAMGLHIAGRFIDAGARHLILLGRRAPDSAAEERLRTMRAQGAQITIAQADVSSASDLARIVEPVRSTLRGVVHAAGVLDDGILLDQTPARFASVLLPKAGGAWNLHEATRGAPLGFFVLLSSAASLIGPPGQGSYAAANAFLDGLAAYRQARGLPALSISWGPWSESGMAAATERRGKARWRARGIQDFSPPDGLELLGRLLGAREAALVALKVNWAEFSAQLPQGLRPPLLRHFLTDEPAASSGPVLRELLAQSPPSARRAILRDRVTAQAAKVLGLQPSVLDPGDPLASLGLDSLMAVELRNVLGSMVGVQLPATLIFDYPTIEGLTNFLALEVLALDLGVGRAIDGAVAQPDEGAFLEAVAQLSEEEAEVLLSRRLEGLN